MPSTLNLYGIRIYNCEVESILSFIALTRENWLTVFKLMAEAQMEVQYCEPLCWQLPVWNKLVLTFHLSFAPQLLFFVCEALHLSQISAWLLKHVAVSWCSARRTFFFRSRLISSLCSVSHHVCVSLLAWHHFTRLSQWGHFLSSHSSKHCRP